MSGQRSMTFTMALLLISVTQTTCTSDGFLSATYKDHALSHGSPLMDAFARVFLSNHVEFADASEEEAEGETEDEAEDSAEGNSEEAEDRAEGNAEELAEDQVEEKVAESAEQGESAEGATEEMAEEKADSEEEMASEKTEETAEEVTGEEVAAQDFTTGCLDFSRALVMQSEGSKRAVADRMRLVCSGFQLAPEVEVCQKYRSTLLEYLSKDVAFNMNKFDYPLFCQEMEMVAREHQDEVRAMTADVSTPIEADAAPVQLLRTGDQAAPADPEDAPADPEDAPADPEDDLP